MDKLFPDMPGRDHMLKVQQQVGVNDCSLFVFAYITLLASGLDPSQYTFDQGSLRFAFRPEIGNRELFLTIKITIEIKL